MPNWQPNWEDVRWNYAAADRAASELDQAAEAIDRTSTARGQASERATAQWRGAYRARFDAQLMDTLGSAWELAGTYRESAARIRQASARAREEQARREHERERWRQEKASEDAAARARRKAASATATP
ncbi:MAG: hypothetical protein M3069_04655 [Chloroflexota bacterium]|nr:hypothetical protein [Chloroflexota bacterium]